MVTLQGSLLDLGDQIALGRVGEGMTRRHLTHGAWLDVRPGWLTAGDRLLEDLVHEVPWQAERRQMYDSVVDVPRLTRFYAEGEPLPRPILAQARDALSAHYAGELGEPFTTAGMCLYRDGRDSVAWHGDRIGRSREQDTMIAIVSLGADRPLSLRPRDGGASIKVAAGHGDLVVMGGSCQRTWDHAILKTSAVVGPRISVQFRVSGVR
ncbi:MAG TPA: alpha-ketoglutarate-dependent dioxygenase AlkB [Phycicoccus elongatus]|jgi:alkylated DNA repair dioxygenase AlkB|uniref:alpha-ketoglutarate-dependent dioxygenase AlkB n=1 Tax=Phycicoccus TaxID=367298 RepID=UPI002C62C877|nr:MULTISPECIES: alpha-ketoglutarate-dependent dioxygenase AlkB [Phycicoccus]MBK8728156.1 alpha-ketoglutarate-dependent dioxygenase AlkB [Tetrasphaera sp.]MCB9405232.1 alpha-ketoglutarate-dependent dioxygenase AlkB [Tetrasphaera sp.]HOA67364.1 alpha-ketoglutarate-dependent dioxygenase AlkB [Phycicoccus elongatus]HPF76506.1 alpha-ketoglutarate-dependent dioxygenase AlkB [Phycicoccus elongatus]HPK13109.1 alpha-ketoglutarate-dependent dioxygenase AlkB [Phycicoccus elongatus]